MRHWDLELPRWPGDWQGLEFLVERGDLPPRPAWRFEVVAGWRQMRACDGGGPLVWSQRHLGCQGAWWLLAERGPPAVVPPIVAGDLRAMPEPLHSRA